MYNLLVSFRKDAWKSTVYEYEKDRVFQYTPQYFCDGFSPLSDEVKDRLTKIPSLFIHEGFKGKSRIGYIREIKENYGKYHLALDYCYEISSKKLSHLVTELGFTNWFETGTTHWAVKDIDLINLLLTKRILTDKQSLSFIPPVPLPEIKFDIAFSFPGEKRELISRIVDILKKKNYSVFYDKDYDGKLAMPGMDLLLMDVYKKQSKLICIFLSKEYNEKEWCQLEWSAIRDIITERKRNESILFFKFDDADITGVLSSYGYINIDNLSPEEISDKIINRFRMLRNNEGINA